jgi:hypothetical protein
MELWLPTLLLCINLESCDAVAVGTVVEPVRTIDGEADTAGRTVRLLAAG